MTLISLIMQNPSWFSTDNIVAITAVIGCFTGCISFGMMLHKTLKEKIKFKFKVEETTLHFDNPKGYDLNSKSERQGLIRITTLNLSHTPATIHKIKIYPKHQKDKEISFWIKDVESMEVFFLNEEQESQIREFYMVNQYDLPVRVDGVDAFSGFIFLPKLEIQAHEHLALIVEFYVGDKTFKTECILTPIEETTAMI